MNAMFFLIERRAFPGTSPSVAGLRTQLQDCADSLEAPNAPPGGIDDAVAMRYAVLFFMGDQEIADASGLEGRHRVLLAPVVIDPVQLF